MSKTNRSPRFRLLIILLTPVILLAILTSVITIVHIDQNGELLGVAGPVQGVDEAAVDVWRRAAGLEGARGRSVFLIFPTARRGGIGRVPAIRRRL